VRHAIVVAGALLVSSAVYAQSAADLQAEGEKAAKEGNFANAIDKFKAADRIAPRASHACLIALAYTRRNLWPQAEIFRTKCHERASPTDPLPDWMTTADKQIDDAIGSAVVSAVTITVEPADAAAAAQLTVSSFAPDEKFPPRTIHLPPGIHQIFANAPGYEEGHQLVDVKDDKKPINVVIKLYHPGEAPPDGQVVRSQPATPPPVAQSKTPWIIIGTGVGIAALGGVLDATWYKSARDDLAKLPVSTTDPYKSAEDTWSTRRNVVIGCYVVGGLTAVTGVILKYTVFNSSEHAPAVSFVPRDGGGMVSVGWSR
jgi:hypothetical protein